jgi:hypothetical protein
MLFVNCSVRTRERSWLCRRFRSPVCCGDCGPGAGLTQEELAEATGVSPRAISDLERGAVTTPHKDTVRLLADALNALPGSAQAGEGDCRW